MRTTNYNFDRMIHLLEYMYDNHTSSELNKLKSELNAFFKEAKCLEVLYTNNTDKLFFGMRVYPVISGDKAINIIHSEEPKVYDQYYVELDSKLFDPMMCLNGRELTAILLHEIGHIVCDSGTTDEVKKQLDLYFANANDSIDLNASEHYKELIAYALKDSVIKAGSLFSKIGDDEMIADAFVASCGFGADLESAFRKICRSTIFVNKNVDGRFITFAWVLRLYKEVKIKRLPAIHTLNKAKQLTASQLEKREINNAVNRLNRLEDNISESIIDNVKARFNKNFTRFKAKGIRGIKDDVYELNLRLRTIESQEDALYIIRLINSDVSILEDYVTEPELSEQERQDVYSTLEELYSIRSKAAKEAHVREKYSSMIQVIYPDIK